MSSQRSFSNSFPRRLNSSSRSSFFRDFPIDDEDMFFESNPNWDFPPSGQLGGSIFDTFPRRSTMRSFPSHHFENTSSGSHDPFASGWHHPSWVEDEMRRSRGSSPSPTDRTDSRRSPTPPNPTSSGPRSGSGSPGVGSQTFFGRNDGFPIKVVHEGTSRTPSRSSTPSSGAGEANPEASCESPTVPPPGVEKFPGVTSKVHSNAYSARRLPKVHHIPIRVEPRDDGPGPSPSRATPPPPNIDPRIGHNGDNASPCASPRHNRKANQSQPAKKSAMPRVIPVQMNSSKCQTPPPPADRLPTPEHQERAPSPAPPRKTPPTPFEVIEGVLHAVHEMEERVGEFSGTRAEKEYLFLDEMLTRNLIKLDNIETDGNADLRQSRKAAIQEVNRLIHKLEANVVKPLSESETMDTNALVSEQPTVAEEPMESDPNAAPSIEKGEATETVVKDNSLQAHVEIENADSATKNNVSSNTADVAASTVETSDSAEPSVLEVTTTPEAVDSYTESKDIQKTEQESKPVFKTTVELQVAGDCTASLPNGDAISEELMQALT